jgi:hypothetical protein
VPPPSEGIPEAVVGVQEEPPGGAPGAEEVEAGYEAKCPPRFLAPVPQEKGGASSPPVSGEVEASPE